MQGVIKSYDPGTDDGTIVGDTDFVSYDLAPGAVAAAGLRFVRQGQRLLFTVNDDGLAADLRFGSEVDMGTPGFFESLPSAEPVADET
ncbi:MAG: hypothetical protein M9952_03355 [Microthrixaceae bacterium]|nr:hypothetical protein [Microthrixaceae bacterium]MCO5311956.1 hypothetical protein [Microthrixaceae bacterium]HPB46245.1 hypothetical protein [Microthrixaceae bacterium]